MSQCTEELIWLNEKEEEELAFDWSENNTNMAAKREQYAVSYSNRIIIYTVVHHIFCV